MDALRVAAPLARLLLAVGDARRDGVLRVEQPGRVARLQLRAGQLCGLEGIELEPLGDILRELRALHGDAVVRDTGPRHPLPIGLRLVANGATSWASVREALRIQRVRALDDLLGRPVLRIAREQVMRASRAAVDTSLTELVWQALMKRASALSLRLRFALACVGEPLQLTSVGRVRSASLAIDDLQGALSREETQRLALRAVLCALGLARSCAQRREDTYSLLLRKRRELARNAGPRALLDLPRDASPEHAQRALRVLATKLHPDRFHTDDARLHRLSHEVMGALTRAASSFRS